MEYVRQYQNRINWQNEPSLNTPINETNLNKIDKALNYMDEKLSEAIGGGIVEANPSETAEESLNKVAINGIVYGIPGGGSYTAGNGISISNSVITNIRKGALTGVVDSISGNIAHTQITGARDTFVAGALILLQSEAAGTADNLRIQYGAQSSESQTFAIYDTSSTAASVTIASGDTVIMMIDNTGYRAIILNVLSASGGSSYAGLGIGKKTGVSSNVIDTDIDLHRAPIVGDRLLIYFDEKVTNPTGLTTYNNGTAVTGNLENVTPLYINAGWNILEFKNDGFLYNNVWVRKQNVPIPNNTLVGLSDTAIISPSDGQLLTYDSETQKWKNKTYVEANAGFSDTELKKLKVGNVVYDTDGLRDYFVSSIANNNITISVLNSAQFVMENIAINTGAHSGSSSAWNLILNDGMNPVSVALTKADGTAFADDIHENELLLVYVDTAGNTARVLDISVDNTEIKTATGNPITLTDAIAGNALDVSAEIVASQSGSGTPSPTNIRPISGFSSVTITREDAQGQTATVTVSFGSTVYGGTLDLTSGELTVTHGYKDLGTLTWRKDTTTRPADGATIHAFYAEIRDMVMVNDTTVGNFISSDYVVDTVRNVDYGGYQNVKDGIIGGADSHNRIWVYDSRYNEYSTTDFKTAMSGVQIVYELATPTTTTLTAAQLALVKGQNTLTCNSGDMEITYKASGLDALKERVDELEDAVEDIETDMASKAENSTIGTVESGTTASQPYAVGEHFIRNDKFCTAIAAIASGATLTLNTNYVEGTIAENLYKRVNYSYYEHVIGTWVDGSTLYEKTISCGSLPNNTAKFIDAGIGVPARVVHFFGSATVPQSHSIPLPFTYTDNTWSVALTYYPSNYHVSSQQDKLEVRANADQSGFTISDITIQYIKL